MNESIPHEDLCGARTRAGGNCRRRPAPDRRRCNLHGGKSPRGAEHPRFKHGRYSKYRPLFFRSPAQVEEDERRARQLRERLHRESMTHLKRELAKLPANPSVTQYLAAMRRANAAHAEARAAKLRLLKKGG